MPDTEQENATQDTEDVVDESTAGGAQQDERAPSLDDLTSKLEGQKKVNRDLERKLDEARRALDRLPTLEAEIAKLQGREAEYAEQQKAREAERAALAKADERILRAEVRAAATGRLADPADAFAYIDLSSFEVGDDGEVDAAAIGAAIEDLISRKPYLAAQGGRRFQGDADGGARKEEPKTLADQIAEAEKAGDYTRAMRLKAQALTAAN